MLVCRVATVAFIGFAGACDENQSKVQRPSVSYAVYESGSAATATNPASFELISADGPVRFARFQQLITKTGAECNWVNSAILKGGLLGTDEWRVNCTDSGEWSIWFHANRRPEIISCSTGACV